MSLFRGSGMKSLGLEWRMGMNDTIVLESEFEALVAILARRGIGERHGGSVASVV